MRDLRAAVRLFRRDDAGGTTVEWVVLTASAISITLSVFSMVASGSGKMTDSLGQTLSTQKLGGVEIPGTAPGAPSPETEEDAMSDDGAGSTPTRRFGGAVSGSGVGATVSDDEEDQDEEEALAAEDDDAEEPGAEAVAEGAEEPGAEAVAESAAEETLPEEPADEDRTAAAGEDEGAGAEDAAEAEEVAGAEDDAAAEDGDEATPPGARRTPPALPEQADDRAREALGIEIDGAQATEDEDEDEIVRARDNGAPARGRGNGRSNN
ncbi:hypothetical protein ACQ5SP_02350 [Rhodovulum sp. YNF3179]|uniref:hypothetical protein n=1 Tax=Rhodovulum sp. YNF3179 TaxID=3425127 RepID=UPI003D342745